DVFVGGGVEDDTRPPPGEDLLDSGSMTNASDAGHQADLRELQQQLAVEMKQPVLSLLDEQQWCRPEVAQRPTQLRTTAPAGAANQDRPAVDDARDGLVVQPDRLPV